MSGVSASGLLLAWLRVGGQILAFEARHAAGLHGDGGQDDAAVPLLATCLGLDADTSAVMRVLELRDGNRRVRVRVAGEVTLARVVPAQLHPLPELVARTCRLPGLQALALPTGHEVGSGWPPWLVCDARRWLSVLMLHCSDEVRG